MKFVLSFSGGKDSILALHKMIAQGHEPVGLLVMCRESQGRSWTHGINDALLSALADALNIPLLCCHTEGEDYEGSMERGLLEARERGAEACVFGDIDLEEHRQWNEARCRAAGLGALLPLWNCNREDCVQEVIALGYSCVIKCIKNVSKMAHYRNPFWARPFRRG